MLTILKNGIFKSLKELYVVPTLFLYVYWKCHFGIEKESCSNLFYMTYHYIKILRISPSAIVRNYNIHLSG